MLSHQDHPSLFSPLGLHEIIGVHRNMNTGNEQHCILGAAEQIQNSCKAIWRTTHSMIS